MTQKLTRAQLFKSATPSDRLRMLIEDLYEQERREEDLKWRRLASRNPFQVAGLEFYWNFGNIHTQLTYDCGTRGCAMGLANWKYELGLELDEDFNKFCGEMSGLLDMPWGTARGFFGNSRAHVAATCGRVLASDVARTLTRWGQDKYGREWVATVTDGTP